jgi:urease accessory protein
LRFETSSAVTGWAASLALDFRREAERTVLAGRRHHGPLVVQKPLYPEGGNPCHVVLIHPPGGVAGGDRLALSVDLAAGSQALLTTPAATKWYRAEGLESSQTTRITAADGAVIEYLPQETIVYDQALVRSETTVDLTGNGRLAFWEIVSLGRRASGERFQSGCYRQRLTIRRDGRKIWFDAGIVPGGGAILDSPVGLGGAKVMAAMVIAAGAAPPDLIEACRADTPPDGVRWGISALEDIVTARYLGQQTEAARHWFEALWHVLRPWYAGRAAVRPRLWST